MGPRRKHRAKRDARKTAGSAGRCKDPTASTERSERIERNIERRRMARVRRRGELEKRVMAVPSGSERECVSGARWRRKGSSGEGTFVSVRGSLGEVRRSGESEGR